MKTTEPPIINEQVYPATIEAVWNALTKLDEMKQWYFADIDQFRPEVGSRSVFAVHSEDRTFTHTWEVTEVVPLKSITYSWHYPEYPGFAYVTFALSQEKDNIRLTLTMKITEDFPDEIPEFARESCVGGWNYFLGEQLTQYLGRAE